MPNEIIVRVKVIEDDANKIIREKIKVDAANLGDTIAVNVNEHVTQRLEREARAESGGSGGYSRAGDAIGDTIGKRVSEKISERIKVDVSERLRDSRGRFMSGGGTDREHVSVSDHETVHVDVDVNKKSFMQQLASFGGDIKDKISGFFSGGLSAGISSVFSGDVFSTMIKGALITFAVTVVAPALGIALAASILAALGGGVLAAGIVAAFQDPQIQAAATGLKDKLKPLFSDFGENFKGPVLDFINGLKGVIDQVSPMIDKLGRDFGPIADAVGDDLIGFLQNALPGILRAADDAGPVIQTIADNLPGIGDAIGRFFDHIRKNGPAASQFFEDLLNFVQLVIRALGVLIDALAEMYTVTRAVIVAVTQMFLEWAGAVLGAARIAFGWIPGLGPKLDRASEQFQGFKNKVNRYLNEIPNKKDIQIRLHVVLEQVLGAAGAIFRQIYGKAAGGVVGGIAHAATGGSRNGLTMVGEHGPELADMAPGSRVFSNADSLRMAGQMGAGGGNDRPIVINLIMDGKQVARATLDPMREIVRNSFGGDVQMAYGS